jgi:hypothetical protein
MWIAWVVFGIVSAGIIVVALAARRRPARPKRLHQDPIADPAHGHLPEPGTDEPARRRDGSLMPGSEEYRNRQGRR